MITGLSRNLAILSIVAFSQVAVADVQLSIGRVVGDGLKNTPLSVEVTAFGTNWQAGLTHLSKQRLQDSQGNTGEVSDFVILSAGYRLRADLGDFLLEFSPGLSIRSRGHNVGYSLPSTVNVSLSLGLSKGPVVVEWRHLSNAETRSTNRGQDWLALGYRF